jgi:diguanylate cyclase (GGDEF)-like protein/PAS domain S-box-containing protein
MNEAVLRQIIDSTADLLVVFDEDGQIVFVNNAVRTATGGEPDEYIGTNIVDYVHPDELEQALSLLELSATFGGVPGSANFHVLRRDGTYVDLELSVGSGIGTSVPLRYVLGRNNPSREALETILRGLVIGGDFDGVMTALCDVFDWRVLGSQIAVAWCGVDGRDRCVSTGLPQELAEPDLADGSPWSEARRLGTSVVELDLQRLSKVQRSAASALGLAAYWIESVESPGSPAFVTVWTRTGGMPPSAHSQGMDMVRNLLPVILKWVNQERRLDFSATHDELTEIGNRKAFFDALDQTPAGAVLYCDLDGFKSVNDGFGHTVGDGILQLVADRIAGCLRDGDFLARLGGDEFGVICPGAGPEAAEQISERIRTAIDRPFAVKDVEIRITITVGIGVGVGQGSDRLGESVVEAADLALYREKRSRAIGRA